MQETLVPQSDHAVRPRPNRKPLNGFLYWGAIWSDRTAPFPIGVEQSGCGARGEDTPMSDHRQCTRCQEWDKVLPAPGGIA